MKFSTKFNIKFSRDFFKLRRQNLQIPDEHTLNLRFEKNLKMLIIAGFVMVMLDLTSSFIGTASIVSDGSKLYILRTDRSGQISLNADVKGDWGHEEKQFDVIISPYKEESASQSSSKPDSINRLTAEEAALQELQFIVSGFNDDTSQKAIFLPSSLTSGESVKWSRKRSSHTATIIFIVMTAAILLFRQRLAPLDKLRKKNLESVSRQLPEFVNQLVLLLNAGLVLNTAFEKAIDEGIRFKGREQDYFWSRMGEIRITVRETNGSANSEFRKFAKETGTTDMIRISNILNDNISKGVELTDKLISESEMLWANRKRKCEEESRISETKLVFPLTLMLLILIAITVTPALLEL